VLVREARAARLDLHPLADDDLRALVRARYALPPGDEDHLAVYLRDRAEGNPFFTGEVLRTLEEARAVRPQGDGWTLGDLAGVGVPPLLRQVLDTRVARLGAAAERLLALAAVIGQEPPLALWAAVAGVDEAALLGPVERATAARLLAEAPDGLRVRFVHALIREALYEGLPPSQRRRVHRQAGEALLAARGHPAPDPDAVAYHFQQAGDPRAVEWLIAAGERARLAYAWVSAAARYEAALALLETQGGAAGRRGWLAFRLGALRRYADARRALANTEAAGRLAREADDALLAGMAEFLAGMLLDGYLRQPERGVPRMETGLRALAALPAAARVPPGADAPLDPAPRWGTILITLVATGRQAEALVLAERYFAEVAPPAAADWLGGNPYADAVTAMGQAYRAAGQPEQARAALARARGLYCVVGNYHQERVAVLAELAVVLDYQTDRPAEIRQLLAGAAEAQARAEGAGAFALPRGRHPSYLLLTGRWGEARRIAEAMPPAGGQAPLGVLEPPTLGWLYREQGEATLAGTLVAATLPGGPDTSPGHAIHATVLQVQHLAALLALDAGDLPTARAWLDAHDRWLAWSGAVLGRAEGALGWAAYHRTAGDSDQARQHAGQALAHATEPRQPLALLAAHRLLGELATAAGQHTEAQTHLSEALALADACAAPYERALTLLALAELHVATGAHEQAAALTDEARSLLLPLEARPALVRADALAARLAAALPAPASPAGLSPREAEVLRLVAEGLTNAQIAQRLYLSPRTVDQHLRAIFNKLGVGNRAAAAAFAVAHGLR
jgi:DNA-binding CsgD family transcriptional regulator